MVEGGVNCVGLWGGWRRVSALFVLVAPVIICHGTGDLFVYVTLLFPFVCVLSLFVKSHFSNAVCLRAKGVEYS